MVDDVAAAVSFYTTHLGFTLLTNQAPAFADVKRGNLRLLLSGPDQLGWTTHARRQAAWPGRVESHPSACRRHRCRSRPAAGGGRGLPERRGHRSRREADPARRSVRQPDRAVSTSRSLTGPCVTRVETHARAAAVTHGPGRLATPIRASVLWCYSHRNPISSAGLDQSLGGALHAWAQHAGLLRPRGHYGLQRPGPTSAALFGSHGSSRGAGGTADWPRRDCVAPVPDPAAAALPTRALAPDPHRDLGSWHDLLRRHAVGTGSRVVHTRPGRESRHGWHCHRGLHGPLSGPHWRESRPPTPHGLLWRHAGGWLFRGKPVHWADCRLLRIHRRLPFQCRGIGSGRAADAHTGQPGGESTHEPAAVDLAERWSAARLARPG